MTVWYRQTGGCDEYVNDVLVRTVDYNKVHARLAELRSFTKNYVKDALSKSGIDYDKNYR